MKKMKKTTQHRTKNKKLALSRETLRSLQNIELQQVAGGFSADDSCTPECNVWSDLLCQ